jgi:hypothetical protein
MNCKSTTGFFTLTIVPEWDDDDERNQFQLQVDVRKGGVTIFGQTVLAGQTYLYCPYPGEEDIFLIWESHTSWETIEVRVTLIEGRIANYLFHTYEDTKYREWRTLVRNVHYTLGTYRQITHLNHQARSIPVRFQSGPNLLLVGGMRSGKTTLSRYLVSMALESGESVWLANCDSSGGGFVPNVLPGVVTIHSFSSMNDPGNERLSRYVPASDRKSFVSGGENVLEEWSKRLNGFSFPSHFGGLIVDSPSWTTSPDEQSSWIVNVVRLFSIMFVVVLGTSDDHHRVKSFLPSIQVIEAAPLHFSRWPHRPRARQLRIDQWVAGPPASIPSTLHSEEPRVKVFCPASSARWEWTLHRLYFRHGEKNTDPHSSLPTAIQVEDTCCIRNTKWFDDVYTLVQGWPEGFAEQEKVYSACYVD